MHIADPNARDLRRQRHRRPPACRSPSAPPTAAQLRADGGVAVAFFGDGAPAQGAFHEAVNLAAVWRLPVVFFCENNGYAEFSPAVDAARGAARAAGRRLRRRATSRSTATTSWRPSTAMARRRRRRSAPAAARSSSRPPPTAGTATTRATPSATGRPRRSQEWEGRDPLARPRRAAPRRRRRRRRDQGARGRRSPSELDAAVEAARRLASPAPATLSDFVVRARPAIAEPPPVPDDAAGVPHDGRRSATRSRPSWRPTSGCSSPASTSAPAATCSASPAGCATGSATGCATRRSPRRRSSASASARRWPGMRPVVEVMYLDFLGVCLDQLLNQAAKLPFMTGGAAADGADRPHPVRRRPVVGQPALPEPRGAARPHPRPHRRHAVDAGRHLRPAAGRDPGPEPGGLHREPAALRHEGPAAAGRPPRPDRPVARSCARAPTSRWCRCRAWSTRRSPPPRRVAADGISVEVIDLRTVAPLDMAPILESVAQDQPPADRPRGGRPLRHRRRDRRHRRPRGVLGPRRPDRARRRRRHAAALRPRPRAGLAPRPRRHRRRDPPPRGGVAPAVSRSRPSAATCPDRCPCRRRSRPT